MQTLHVDSNVLQPPSYHSASRAISAEMGTGRSKQAEVDSRLIGGLELTDFDLMEQAVNLYLSNGYILSVFTADRCIEWKIRKSDALDITHATYGPFNLVWKSGDQSIWDPEALLKARQFI
jgi:hypothetical protein